TQDQPALLLAPMEGITDASMRSLQSESGAFQFCVSEFIRVSHHPVPAKVFSRCIPELENGARTLSGIPVPIQLLGGDPVLVAESAAIAVDCGAQAIDLNFGCPAPTVNRHDGGATLLKCPARIRAMVRAVRSALDVRIPVSAKVRLGWEDPGDVVRNVAAAIE